MDGYLESPSERRRLICQQAQAQLDLPDTSLEKDYWVCWTLRQLFGLPAWAQNITFKGGTSLSKCWGLISRFSEDIDIVIDKHFLGFGGEESPEEAPSKKQQKKRLDAMKEAAQEKIHGELAPALAARIGASLPESDTWELVPASEEEDRDRQTLLFKYPTAIPETQPMFDAWSRSSWVPGRTTSLSRRRKYTRTCSMSSQTSSAPATFG